MKTSSHMRMSVNHTNLGSVKITEACQKLQDSNPDPTSVFVEHDGEIKEVSSAAITFTAKNVETIKQKGRPPKKGAGKLGKTEVLQFRIDPMSRFAIELAARYQKRTLSSAFDVAVEAYIKGFTVNAMDGQIQSFTQDSASTIPLMDIVSEVWDHDEALRFLKLAQVASSLLSPEEKAIWNVIKKEPIFHKSDNSIDEGFVKKIWNKLLTVNADTGLSGIDFKSDYIEYVAEAITDQKKIAALRAALDDIY